MRGTLEGSRSQLASFQVVIPDDGGSGEDGGSDGASGLLIITIIAIILLIIYRKRIFSIKKILKKKIQDPKNIIIQKSVINLKRSVGIVGYSTIKLYNKILKKKNKNQF